MPPSAFVLGVPSSEEETRSLLHVLSFDPGEGTGWTYLRMPIDDLLLLGFTSLARDQLGVVWQSGQFWCRNENAGVDFMVTITRCVWQEVDQERGDILIVVMEDFILRERTTDRSLLSPVRLAAKYEYAMRQVRFAYWKELAADALRVVTDDRLRRWRLWRQAPLAAVVHARDAMRHAVLVARRYQSDERYRSWAKEHQYVAEADDVQRDTA